MTDYAWGLLTYVSEEGTAGAVEIEPGFCSYHRSRVGIGVPVDDTEMVTNLTTIDFGIPTEEGWGIIVGMGIWNSLVAGEGDLIDVIKSGPVRAAPGVPFLIPPGGVFIARNQYPGDLGAPKKLEGFIET